MRRGFAEMRYMGTATMWKKCVAVVSAFLLSFGIAHADSGSVRVGGTYPMNHLLVKQWAKAFAESRGDRAENIRIDQWFQNDNILRFAKVQCDVLVHHYSPLTEMDKLTPLWELPKGHSQFESGAPQTTAPVGQARGFRRSPYIFRAKLQRRAQSNPRK